MSDRFIFIVYTYSPLHAGTGQSIGKVDLPIEREKHTEYPCVYATGLKGSLRKYCENYGKPAITSDKVKLIFGDEDSNSAAGGAVFTDLKILLFPVRSSEGSFKWITSQHVINRFNRDHQLVTGEPSKLNFGTEEKMVTSVSHIDVNRHILLEDFVFEKTKKNESLNLLDINLSDVYVVHEDIFKYLILNATQIIARNKLDKKKISENLWYEEALPADTILYSFVLPSVATNGEIDTLRDFLDGKVIQVGGGETVGYGICKINLI